MTVNIYAAWIGFLLGALAGAATGLFFHKSDWLGGYASWERRMIRLGHIAFFGLGFLNLGFAVTAKVHFIGIGLAAPSALLIVGAATMPAVCYLSAWRPVFRQLFFIPAGSVTLAVALFTWRIMNG